MHRQSWDVVIVGAGPAGATLGYELARRGLAVLILEKHALPRYKPCGGGITLRTARALGLDLTPVLEDTVSDLTVTHARARGFHRRTPRPFLHTVMRDRFDYLLVERAQRAGAVIWDRCTVQRVATDAGQARVVTTRGEVVGQVLAGADGATGLVARSVGLLRDVPYCVALEAEVAVSPSEIDHWRGTIAIDFGYTPWGYGWVFPKAAGLSVGGGVAPTQGREVRRLLDAYLATLKLKGARVTRVVGHPIRFRSVGEPIQTGHTLLLGDAAGLADNLTAEGIYYAIRSAQIAAPHVVAFLQSEVPDLAGYQQEVDATLGGELQLAKAITTPFYRLMQYAPWIIFQAMRHSETLWEYFCDLQRGEITYQELRQRLRFLVPLARLLAR